MEFHPKVYEKLLKCYFYIGDFSFDYFLKVLEILPLSKKYNLEEEIEKDRPRLKKMAQEKEDESLIEVYENTHWDKKSLKHSLFPSLKDYLESLPEEDIFKLLSDIFPSSEFKKMERDRWNHYGEFVKDWRRDLTHYLKICGITYDDEKRQFIKGKDEINLQEAIYKSDILNINFEDPFYNKLVLEINKAYKIGSYTGSFILCRKLIENLIIDILRKKFPQSEENLAIYYRKDDSRFHDFSILVKNLELKKEDFGIDQSLIEQSISLIKQFRPISNSKAHSITLFGKEGDINKFKIEEIVGLLMRIKNKID